MEIYSLYIINKSGGLIFHESFSPDAPNLSNNDHLRLGSTFHGLHTIAANLSVFGRSGGIEVLHTDTFRLECFQSPTGVKFFVTADRNHQHLEQTLRAIYELYSDYVLKNPFYELDQPIRCERFQQSLQALISRSRE